MKKAFFLTVALLAAIGVGAQCKYEVNEYDPFLKAQKIQTKTVIAAGMFDKYTGRFCKIGDTLCFKLLWVVWGSEVVVVGPSTPFIFLFEDGSTIELHPSGIYSGDIDRGTGSTITSLNAIYPLSFQQAKDLSSKRLKAVRMYTTSDYREAKVKSSFVPKIMKAVGCVL